MKRLVFAAALVLLASSAFGEIQDFGRFSVDVPDGWEVRQENSTLLLSNKDKTAAMTITSEASNGRSAEELAHSLAGSFRMGFARVSAPQADPDGSYHWNMTASNGMDTLAKLSVNGHNYLLLTMTNIASAPGDFAAMLKSIRAKEE